MFRHPNYYKELRKRNKEAVAKSGISSHASLESDQAISPTRATAPSRRATGPGLEVEIIYQDLSSLKHQAASTKPQASSRKRLEDVK